MPRAERPVTFMSKTASANGPDTTPILRGPPLTKVASHLQTLYGNAPLPHPTPLLERQRRSRTTRPHECPVREEGVVVSVIDPTDEAVWGCEAHAAQALDAIADTRINQVCDWDAARRLRSLRWNHRDKSER